MYSSSKQIRRSWKNARDEIELTPLIESTVTPAVPKIRRIPTILKQAADESNNSSAGGASSINRGIDAAVKNMDNAIPRFGPLYMVDQPSVQATKDKAWDHVLKKSLSNDGDEGVIKEIYLTAIRKVEKQAKEAYYNNNNKKLAVAAVGSTFRWMMIRDGCFFLHLVFVILGCSEHLGYAPNDPIFGKRRSNNNRDQFKKWIESMFYVGNQVPLVVLEELMSQKFFQEVITKAAKGGLLGSGPPPGLSKKVLYDVVVLPALKKQAGRQIKQTTTATALDLLHGLQSLVMGPKPLSSPAPRYDPNINIDLEANEDDEMEEYEEEEEDDRNQRRILFPCATELEQAGISFTKLESRVGARSIRFQSWYMWATICLPVLPVDGNTETLLRNLKTYEACHQQLGNVDGREVESYLKFMSDLVQTAKDARLLIRRGIIADISYADRLPGLLRRLSSEQNVRLTHEFSRLRRQIRDYSSPWAYYKNFMSIVVILTLIQTLFALLSYFRPPKP